MPVHYGRGAGLSNRRHGEKSGFETHTLSVGEMPSHTHPTAVTSAMGDTTSPVGAVPATANDGESNYSSATAGLSSVNGSSAGSDQTHNNMPPYLAINFSIALVGVYPSRS